MGKHSIFGISKVAGLWLEVYEKTNVGMDINEVISKCGEPDEILDLGDTKMLSWVNEEWKGFLRGGTITRKLIFVVKDNKIISKSGQNLERSGL